LEDIRNITEDEWLELHWEITAATNALALAFDPDHFNYAFLQNQDRHVHLHVIPRYASARTFAGRQFGDPDYPDHYAVPALTIILASEQTAALANELRRWRSGCRIDQDTGS
jgi:diadenosine tetraphosphate (Ap4A) HIT family hydrolase